MSELLPCPFCGGEAGITWDTFKTSRTSHARYRNKFGEINIENSGFNNGHEGVVIYTLSSKRRNQ